MKLFVYILAGLAFVLSFVSTGMESGRGTTLLIVLALGSVFVADQLVKLARRAGFGFRASPPVRIALLVFLGVGSFIVLTLVMHDGLAFFVGIAVALSFAAVTGSSSQAKENAQQDSREQVSTSQGEELGIAMVEFVIAVEKRFDVKISDDVAKTLNTVGSLHAFVVSELQRADPSVDAVQISAEIHELLATQLGVSSKQITAETRIGQDLRAD